jgi:predicted transcriptional regulator
MATLTFRVPDDLKRELERRSIVQGVSQSGIAREALRRYLQVTDFRALRREMTSRTQLSGVATDGDVFARLDQP